MIKFKNRREAAILLAGALSDYKNKNLVVLAIPKGGVPFGQVIAKELHVPLDIILSKKIAHPFQKEFVIGAVSTEDYVIDTPVKVKQEYIDEEISSLREVMKNKYSLLRCSKKPIELKDKIVIIVDDGIATGNTAVLAVRMARRRKASRVIVASPVISREAEEILKKEADKVVALELPYKFKAVGEYYEDFQKLTDEEVIEMLK